MGTAYAIFTDCPTVQTTFTSDPTSVHRLTSEEAEKGKQAVLQEVESSGQSKCVDEFTVVSVIEKRLWGGPLYDNRLLIPGGPSRYLAPAGTATASHIPAERQPESAMPPAPPKEIPSVRVEDLPDARTFDINALPDAGPRKA